MAEPNEDVPYNMSEHAIADEENKPDEDQPNKSILREVVEYLEESIATHNSLDAIDLNKPGDMDVTQQTAVHKLVVNHLRTIKTMVDNKIKELK